MGLGWGGVGAEQSCQGSISDLVPNSTLSLKAKPMRLITDCESLCLKLSYKRSCPGRIQSSFKITKGCAPQQFL